MGETVENPVVSAARKSKTQLNFCRFMTKLPGLTHAGSPPGAGKWLGDNGPVALTF